MTKGTIDERTLVAIANAVRQKAGTSFYYRACDLPAAVEALDGTTKGSPYTLTLTESRVGLIDDRILTGIADAIRAKEGTETRYKPGDMPTAILGLSWAKGLLPRAVLLSDGTLELNYRDSAGSDKGTVQAHWPISLAGYSSSDQIPWRSSRGAIKAVRFDKSFAESGVTKMDWCFYGCSRLREVRGLENAQKVTSWNYAFSSCTLLQSLYATEFDASNVTSATNMTYSDYALVGGAGHACSGGTWRSSDLTFGDTGLLTNPDADGRKWCYIHYYDDRSAVVTTSPEPNPRKSLGITCRVCRTAEYANYLGIPWDTDNMIVAKIAFSEDMESVDYLNLCYWFSQCDYLESVTGWEHVRGVRNMSFAFMNSYSLVTLDMRGFDASSVTKWNSTFGGCSSLRTIKVDADWALAAGATGVGTFNGCRQLVGGNGTAYDSSKIGAKMAVVDKEGQAGYLTAG